MKVLVDGCWTSAIVRRKHSDGTFKVAFRDGSTEAHVSISRLAITPAMVALNNNKTPGKSIHNFRNDAFDIASQGTGLDSNEEDSQAGSLADFDCNILEDNVAKSSLTEENLGLSDLDELLDTFKRDVSPSMDPAASTEPLSKLYIVVFDGSPLGLTVCPSSDGGAKVARLISGGRAETKGVCVGDILVAINQTPINSCEEALDSIPRHPYPLSMCFKKPSC